ncbi:uncharacterized protein [Anabrus simplex]|uniref:uncharacterized protein n=1 Tax=Anabrus simplex TaxID=316456 RepID=UPI0035A26A04
MKTAPRLGTGFTVSKKILGSVIDFSSPKSRANKKDPDGTDKFWVELEVVIPKISDKHTIILLGDINAQIGRERKLQNIVGKYPAHRRTNRNGERLIELCKAFNLVLKLTAFKHLPMKRNMWTSPNPNLELHGGDKFISVTNSDESQDIAAQEKEYIILLEDIPAHTEVVESTCIEEVSDPKSIGLQDDLHTALASTSKTATEVSMSRSPKRKKTGDSVLDKKKVFYDGRLECLEGAVPNEWTVAMLAAVYKAENYRPDESSSILSVKWSFSGTPCWCWCVLDASVLLKAVVDGVEVIRYANEKLLVQGCILPRGRKIKVTKPHNHEPDLDLPVALTVRDRILQRCRMETVPLKDIYNEEIARAGHLSTHETLCSMTSAMRRARASGNLGNPECEVNEEFEELEDYNQAVTILDMEDGESFTSDIAYESENTKESQDYEGFQLHRSVACGPEVSQGNEYDSDSQQFSSSFEGEIGHENSDFQWTDSPAFRRTLTAKKIDKQQRLQEVVHNKSFITSNISATEEDSDIYRSIASQTYKPPSRLASSQTETGSKLRHNAASVTTGGPQQLLKLTPLPTQLSSNSQTTERITEIANISGTSAKKLTSNSLNLGQISEPTTALGPVPTLPKLRQQLPKPSIDNTLSWLTFRRVLASPTDLAAAGPYSQATTKKTDTSPEGPRKKYFATIEDANNEAANKPPELLKETIPLPVNQLSKADDSPNQFTNNLAVAVPDYDKLIGQIDCEKLLTEGLNVRTILSPSSRKRKMPLSLEEINYLNAKTNISGSLEPHISYVNVKDIVYKVQVSRVTDVSVPSTENKNPVKHFKSSETQTCVSKAYYSIDDFKNDKEGMMYFTGLESYEKFKLVLQSLGPAAYELQYRWGQIISVGVEDQLLITLMKLRRNYSDYELSKNFGISKTTISNIIITWINFMYIQWSELDIWPSRELVNYYMPNGFKTLYPSARVIIDVTEIPIPKPKNAVRQSTTHSENKGRATLKFLVGSTPGGLLSYCSSAFAGSTSDRQTVEYCELVKLCDGGDTVIADKSFNVDDIFADDDVDINAPDFVNGKCHLPGLITVQDFVLGRRWHIERVLGITKTFKILSQELNPYYVPLSSRIFFVCLMLCNFREINSKRNLNMSL